MSFKMTQSQYTSLYGPTIGDSVRLGDTNLFARVEKDYATYGDEATFGGGKSIRDGMAQNPNVTRDDKKSSRLSYHQCAYSRLRQSSQSRYWC